MVAGLQVGRKPGLATAVRLHATSSTMSWEGARRGASMTNAIVPPAAVAVIGLGNMGVPMGACLIKAGYAVTGFDLLEAPRHRFAAMGGRVADDMATAVAAAEVVIMLLPNGKIVREAVSAMRAHLRPGTILVDMSSSDPIGTRSLGEGLIAAGDRR